MSDSTGKPPPTLAPNSWSIDDDEAGFLRAFVVANQVRTVLEFGPGKSTQAFLGAGCLVWSLEHDPRWYEVLRQQLGQPPGLQAMICFAVTAELRIPEVESLRFDAAFIDGPPAS